MTSAQYQAMILGELGLSSDPFAIANVSSWWSIFTDKDTDYLTYLWTKRHAVFYCMGIVRSKYDVQIGFDIFKKSQEFLHLKSFFDALNDEIKMIDSSSFTVSVSVTSRENSFPNMGAVVYSELERYLGASWL